MKGSFLFYDYPEVVVSKWVLYIFLLRSSFQGLVCFLGLTAVGTPRSFHLLVFWILFENVMSLHRAKATVIGLPEASRVNEWIVTEKLGDAMKAKAAI